ncbi:glycosyltransferase [Lysinibacter cavernae]|uniref:4,4'-diaponeurosporenoate glycosyltransferase n=1 Tax=Lysinibacter cavernae TaxID=1640652 RepID=A0A7X5R0V6_9MICO|nr:glycosyltransferase [Lysinibacter cavernae]NIH53330.1 glycosyltransferase involved in cell wall biosynthesis [Lysinibacter cavernae]
MSAVISAMAVVIPVRNEEELVGRCLDSVLDAVAHLAAHATVLGRSPGPDVAVICVLDACDDGTAALVDEARRASGGTIRPLIIDARSVGTARSAGVVHALRVLGHRPLRHVWVANTDADSVVPEHWLSHQYDLARSGVGLMIGTVRPDPDDLSPQQLAAWRATHTPGKANGHVHGANLGFRADHCVSCGGFARISEHEDVGLVDRLIAAGIHGHATDECWVLTSGRTEGRTPGGYARYLREDLNRAPTVSRSETPLMFEDVNSA